MVGFVRVRVCLFGGQRTIDVHGRLFDDGVKSIWS